jgi:hypothetical protein
MIAAQQSAEDLGGVNSDPVVLFCNGIGISFQDDNPIAQNQAVQDVLKIATDVVKVSGTTNFSLDHRDLGHFLHMAYCHTPEGHKVAADFDGILPFKAIDENGQEQMYNAQLITISQQPD